MESSRILVVDDDWKFVEAIQMDLQEEGYLTTGVFGGQEALDILKNQTFDLIILDISMPEINGYEVLEAIESYNLNTLVIIITSFASIESVIRALKMGAWDYLKKPIEYDDLIKTVKNALSQKKLIDQNKSEVITRYIEFPPEFLRAGLQALNYFTIVLNKKYPEKDVGVKIEIKGSKIAFVIKTADGNKETIEKELKN